jgi:hypothetical protein
MTNEEIMAHQAEWRRFTATPAGAALQRFRNLLISETMYGEREDANLSRCRKMEAETTAAHDALVAEIKRLQALETPTDREP